MIGENTAAAVVLAHAVVVVSDTETGKLAIELSDIDLEPTDTFAAIAADESAPMMVAAGKRFVRIDVALAEHIDAALPEMLVVVVVVVSAIDVAVVAEYNAADSGVDVEELEVVEEQ